MAAEPLVTSEPLTRPSGDAESQLSSETAFCPVGTAEALASEVSVGVKSTSAMGGTEVAAAESESWRRSRRKRFALTPAPARARMTLLPEGRDVTVPEGRPCPNLKAAIVAVEEVAGVPEGALALVCVEVGTLGEVMDEARPVGGLEDIDDIPGEFVIELIVDIGVDVAV